jgi:hypothetical protein
MKATNVLKLFIILLVLVALSAIPASGMDRIDALSQIETRNNDRAIGTYGEVSRYQILPEFWAHAMTWNGLTARSLRPTDPVAAKTVADRIMRARCQAFEDRYHRAPNDFEYYILWHRPACFVGRAVPRRISLSETDRARRFASLCQSRQ